MNISNPKVIIVDDELHVREMLSMMMSTINFEVIGEAANGKDVLPLIQKEKPDLILLDTNMPFMNGEEVLEKISRHSQDYCIIMLSIISDTETIKKCLNLGVSYFIRKDTPIPKMINLVQETWKAFEEKRIKVNKYDLSELLEEIKRDEMIVYPDNREISQDDIEELFSVG
ncbi:MAG: hypothetical protein ACD_20C00108G0006 [uncultured bacterium]|nr:MAG: hypothetical protein ACD_20C00108G0006 [uncultured bacterium]HBH19174.1 hypothetical protein [Cyanobacteria bacterium UBA9579]